MFASKKYAKKYYTKNAQKILAVTTFNKAVKRNLY